MEEKIIERPGYYNLGAVLLLIAVGLLALPPEYEKLIVDLGSGWGNWWFHLVDSAHLIFGALGATAIAKAYNYKNLVWPNSNKKD